MNVPAILCGAFFVLRIILRAVLLRAILSVTVLGLIIIVAVRLAMILLFAARESATAGIAHFAFGSFFLLGRELFVNRLVAFGNADSGQLFDGA